MADTKSKSATKGREGEVKRRLAIINEMLLHTPGLSVKKTGGAFSGLGHGMWYNSMRSGTLSERCVEKMVEFSGFDKGVFDGTLPFGDAEIAALKEKFLKTVTEFPEPNQVKKEEKQPAVKEEKKLVKKEPVKKEPAKKQVVIAAPIPSIVKETDKEPVKEVKEVKEVTEAKLLDKFADVLKSADSADLDTVNDALLLTDALKQKLEAKKTELSALRALRTKLTK